MCIYLPKLKVIVVVFCFLSIFSYAENNQWVEWIADAEVSYTQANNLNYSAFSDDSESDAKLAIGATFGRFYQFSGNSRAHVAIDVASEYFNDFSLMDTISTGVNVGFRHKFGLGHYIPYIQLNASYQHNEVDNKPWSHDLLGFDIEVGKHFSQRLSLAAVFSYSKMNGDEWQVILPDISTQVFDQKSWQLGFVIDYIVNQDWLLSLDYNRREGDFHSACTPGNVAKVLDTMQVKAITSDDIFGGCVYQIDGSNNGYTATLSYALSNHAAVNLVVQYHHGDANELDYHSSVFSINYNYRY